MPLSCAKVRPVRARRLFLCAASFLACTLLFLSYTANAHAGSISINSSKTTATINPSTVIEYDASKMKEALWNHGYFYVCFSQGTTDTVTSSATASGSSLATRKYTVSFDKSFAWAKVHVAAVDSCSKSNGGKNKRLKNNSGTDLKFGNYLSRSRKFYVWISDTGGTQGSISLRGTTRRTVYAGGTTFENVNTITVASQLGAERLSQRQSESSANDVINIPFNWTGKLAHQVPYAEFHDKGVGSSGKHAYYRLNWWQYSDGVTYDGFSPYKLQHNSTSARNLWASVNLAAVGITATPSYKESTYKTKTSKVYRNYNTTLGIRLKSPSEQILLNTNGGTLKKGSSTYSGSSVSFSTKHCESKSSLPTTGSKVGKDGTSTGYTLAGYSWSSGTNRKSFSSTSANTSKKFAAFDQASPQFPSASSASVTACNNWQMPAFSSSNYTSDSSDDMLPTVEKAKVTYKANWEPKTFSIHYIVDGAETKTVDKAYDSSYSIESAPAGSQGWRITKQDGTPANSTGYMPSQDIYATAETLSEATVRYFINGKAVATHNIPFGTYPLVNSTRDGITFANSGVWNTVTHRFTTSYTQHGSAKSFSLDFAAPSNPFGGSLSNWYSDEACTVPAAGSVTIGPGKALSFYAFTTHTVHFWMDADALGKSSSEKTCCMTERTYRYGAPFTVPSTQSMSSAVTRPGCEDWAGTCGKWFTDKGYRTPARSQMTCTDTTTLYSYNTVRLSYELTAPAKELDAAEGGSHKLYSDQECTHPSQMRSFLPASTLLRYGESISIEGDGTLYRKTDSHSTRTLFSAEGGFLDDSGEGDVFDTLVLKQSTTVFKDWSQSVFDGIITG